MTSGSVAAVTTAAAVAAAAVQSSRHRQTNGWYLAFLGTVASAVVVGVKCDISIDSLTSPSSLTISFACAPFEVPGYQSRTSRGGSGGGGGAAGSSGRTAAVDGSTLTRSSRDVGDEDEHVDDEDDEDDDDDDEDADDDGGGDRSFRRGLSPLSASTPKSTVAMTISSS